MRLYRLISYRSTILLLVVLCLAFGLVQGETESVLEGLLLNPHKGSFIFSVPIHFDWNDISGAISYKIQIDNSSSFTTPEVERQPGYSEILVYSPNLPMFTTYYWRIRPQYYNAGYYWGEWCKPWYFTIQAPTDVGDNDSPEMPDDFRLEQNFPNPFNLSTTIDYYLPRASEVTLDIYDILGRKIKTLDEGSKKSGRQTAHWDGKNNDGNPVASGIYFYRLKAGDLSFTKKMQLLK